MPTVNRQVANGPAKVKKQGVLERIQAVDDMPETGIKINTYGRGKSGKTRFACTFPKPLLLMGTEDGTKSVKNVHGVDFIRLQSSQDLSDLTDMVREGGGSGWKVDGDELTKVGMGEGDPYQSCCLDHGSGFQSIVLKEVLGLDQLPVQMTWGQAQQSDWLSTAAQFKERVNKLLDLADRQGVHIIIIAHEKNFQEEKPDNNMLVPTIASDLSPTIARWLNGAVDFVVQTFLKDQEVVKKFKQPGPQGKVVEKRVKTGKKDYCLRIGPHDNYITGFRHVDGIEIPHYIVNATYDKILKLVNGEGLEE